MPRHSLEEARTLVAGTLRRCHTSEANARSVARALVAAEADGLKGHGLSRLPSYAAQARCGKVKGMAEPIVDRRTGAVAAVDAAHGFAYPAIDAALAILPGMACEQGVGIAAIRRSHHCGAAGHPVERLAQDGLVGMLFANTPAAIAPWGGSRAVFGTNPIAFACPLEDGDPIVVDLSLSKVARGNILAAGQKGTAIPDDWALDEAGRPTTDPREALRGTMLPFGGAKGTALALMVELLGAGLTGACFAAEASSFLDAEGDPPGTGQLILALDPRTIGGPAALARFGMLAASIEAQPGARLPGSRRLALRAKSERDGIEISEETLSAFAGL